MPKVYKRIKEPINNEDMKAAVTSVMKGTYTIRKAAEVFNVSKSTFMTT
jgi:transposase